EPTVNGPFAGTQDDYIAWLLVACDLGRDCSASSRLLRELCLTTNRCPPGDYREYVRTSLATPQQFQSALVKEKTLLGLIADGRFQKIFPWDMRSRFGGAGAPPFLYRALRATQRVEPYASGCAGACR
ncbi:MAG TPA: hypothetical protein VFG14_05280, partial [Chthoniobacteraceae bacterium]|nr:hypothetical protein [Chthoniobacteraceae bacterium]